MRMYELLRESTDAVPGAAGSMAPEPGTAPIPPGTVRLYHQTSEENLNSIVRTGLGIEHAKGIEGPRAIYASKTGFYGKPGSRPTLEFYVADENWDDPFVLQDIPTSQMVAAHLPWHSKARYIIDHPDILQATLAGKYDHLDGDYKPAVAYIKQHYQGK